MPPAIVSAETQPGPGWVTFARWIPKDGTRMKGFSGLWTVPKPPAVVERQILFLHIGIQGLSAGKTVIIPCVLQWGETPFGGGRYWSVACWSQRGEEVEVSQGLRVDPGEIVEAQIVRTMTTGQEQWEVIARTKDESSRLSIVLEDPLSHLQVFGGVFEVYDPNMDDSKYPACSKVRFRELAIETEAGRRTPRWEAVDELRDGVRRTRVVNSSQVDIFFR